MPYYDTQAKNYLSEDSGELNTDDLTRGTSAQ